MQYKNSMTDYFKTYEAVSNPGGRIDTRMTVQAWWERTILKHQAVQKLAEMHDEQRKKFESEYKPNVVDARMKPYNEEYADVIKIARDEAAKDFHEVLAAKQKAFAKRYAAPDEASLRLLQTLSLRDDLTQSEIASVAGNLGGNINALKALGSIAKRCNLFFPSVRGQDELDEIVANADKWAMRMLDHLGTRKADLGYEQAAFFARPGTGRAAMYLCPLDDPDFLVTQVPSEAEKAPQSAPETPQKKPVEEAKVPASGYNATRVYCTGGEKLGVVAAQFNSDIETIRKMNPGVNLDNLTQGTMFIAPGTRVKISNAPGATYPEACVPYHYDPAASPSYHEGDVVDV